MKKGESVIKISIKLKSRIESTKNQTKQVQREWMEKKRNLKGEIYKNLKI